VTVRGLRLVRVGERNDFGLTRPRGEDDGSPEQDIRRWVTVILLMRRSNKLRPDYACVCPLFLRWGCGELPHLGRRRGRGVCLVCYDTSGRTDFHLGRRAWNRSGAGSGQAAGRSSRKLYSAGTVTL